MSVDEEAIIKSIGWLNTACSTGVALITPDMYQSLTQDE